MKTEKMKELFNALEGADYIDALRLCCHHIAVAMRLQVFIFFGSEKFNA